jgi:beta-ureidopropionase / N-carbamoyl-L-amino-acid hydrolase
MPFADLWRDLEPLGRDPETGGYRRYSWTEADARCRAWFTREAQRRGLTVEPDRNGNLWAWWGTPGPNAIATGSHLDSVPDGGGFDGALGVVSALAAVDQLKERNFYPERAVVLVAFTEEEGARFGVSCLGSRLMTGAIAADRARALTDDRGVTLAAAMAEAGHDPALLGPDDQRLAGLAAFVELHVEQGRALAPLGAPVGVAEGIWPHGRWRLDFCGRADHAGTARLADRHDPMLPYASTVLAAREAAAAHGAVATFGKVIAEPGGVNGVSASVSAWLDARAPDEATLEATIAAVRSAAESSSELHGVTLSVRQESYTPPVHFNEALRDRIATVLANQAPPPDVPAASPPDVPAASPPDVPAVPSAPTVPLTASAPSVPPATSGVPALPTAAGHDAGFLAARLPTAMLFVRNPTGVSHSPAEHADLADCEAGVRALAAVLEDLAGRP